MSTYVVGFRPADEMWNKMKEIWNACDSAGVPVPNEVQKFFNYESPGNKPGMDVDISAATKEYRDDSREGYEVDLTKIPSDVKVIRFYNSW